MILDKRRAPFKIQKGKKSAAETLVFAMGWIHLVLIFLAIPLGFARLLYFMSAGWASVLQACVVLVSGEELPSLTTLSNSWISIVTLGATYALYHVVLVSLFLVAAKKGTRISIYVFGVLSIVILVSFTIMGFGFRWT